jgi:hypothetical protein
VYNANLERSADVARGTGTREPVGDYVAEWRRERAMNMPTTIRSARPMKRNQTAPIPNRPV